MKKLRKPEVVWDCPEKAQGTGVNYGVYCTGQNLGEVERLDEAIRIAEKNWDMAELHIVDYAIGVGYYF